MGNVEAESSFPVIPRLDRSVVGETGSLDHKVESLGLPADPLAMLMPDGEREGKPERWGLVLADYMKKNPRFAERLEKGELSAEDIRMIVGTLEASGGDKMTLDVYAAKLRLLESEFVELANRYPEIKRALAISRVNRKGAILSDIKGLAFRSTAVMKEYMQNPVFKDSLEIKEGKEEETFNSLEEKWEIYMREKGILPCDYTQVVYLTGDKSEADCAFSNKELKKLGQGFVPLDDLPGLFDRKLKEDNPETGGNTDEKTQLGSDKTMVSREIPENPKPFKLETPKFSGHT